MGRGHTRFRGSTRSFVRQHFLLHSELFEFGILVHQYGGGQLRACRNSGVGERQRLLRLERCRRLQQLGGFVYPFHGQ